MKVLEPPVARSTSSNLRPPPDAGTPNSPYRLAAALTGAAAVGGVIELLLERVAGPVLTHGAGPSLAPAATVVSWVGAVAVGTTAILVLLSALAWAGAAWPQNRIAATIILVAAVLTLAAVISGDGFIVALLNVSIAVAAITAVLVLRVSGLYRFGVAAVAVAIVAGQWSLAGWSGQVTVTARVIAEAALVLALLLFAASAIGSGRRRSVAGLTIGATVAAVALVSPNTALVALWASGATLWMPSVVYIGAGAALGLLLATWLPERSTRHLAAGLVLLAVAAIEPTLIHHNLTALVALLALSAVPERGARWR